MRDRILLSALVVLGVGAAASAQSVAYITGNAEPWNQMGNVNALNDVYGIGNWDRTTFAVPADTFSHDVVIMSGGDGATGEFETFINANRASMESFVSNGGVLVVGAARWGGTDGFDLGFGLSLNFGGDSTGTAVDVNHPVYDGPFGMTGANFAGNSLAHDTVSGAGLELLMMGDQTNGGILGEMSFGSGHVIAHGLTLAFFGENVGWSDNTDEFIRNLYSYAGTVPAPGALSLIALGGFVGLRRRR